MSTQLLNEWDVLADELESLRPCNQVKPQLGVLDRLHAAQLSALCLSGGGIRSATFNLGVLQGLAKQQLLDEFDYLSTVSGGGYIGSWLTSWIARHPSGATGVMRELRTNCGAEADEIRHLRKYSNYLTPQLGLTSGDTWTLVTTYIRNLLINWMAFIPLLMAIAMVPHLLRHAVQTVPAGPLRVLKYVVPCVALSLVVYGLRWVNTRRPDARVINPGSNSQSRFFKRCLFPLIVGAFGLVVSWAWWSRDLYPSMALGVALVCAAGLVNVLGLITARLPLRRAAKTDWRNWVIAGASGTLVGLMGALFVINTFPDPSKATGPYTAFGAPLILGIFLFGSAMVVGLASRQTSDEDREWWSRAGGFVIALLLAWTVLATLVLLTQSMFEAVSGWVVTGLGIIGGTSGAVAVLGGFSGKSSGNRESATSATRRDRIFNRILMVAAGAFLVMLIVGIALLNDAIARGFRNALPNRFSDGLNPTGIWLEWLMFGGFLGFSALVSSLIDLNKFSLHSVYRLRLMRAYLGATNTKRNPVEFTGFDPDDSLMMYELWPGTGNPRKQRMDKPFHIINAAMNLVASDNLAWQQRKAASFTFSPLHCGSRLVGFRHSNMFGGRKTIQRYASAGPIDERVSVATAVTVSGAAVSPKMGYHSSPLVGFLLSLFNVRLGWWFGNPGKAGGPIREDLDQLPKWKKAWLRLRHRRPLDGTFRDAAPRDALLPLISEAFGFSGAKSPYVYLSDGGHFDNLGLYEMVRRRCRHIVVVDSGCDLEAGFGDFGNAVRKIRIDFGIPVELQDEMFIKSRKANTAGVYCAVGRVRYSAVDRSDKMVVPDGRLVYLKPSLYGQEPIDVGSFAAACQDFPHESTADQFFNETQFESYRALGEYIVNAICDRPPIRNDLEGFCLQARTQIWLKRDGRAELTVTSIQPQQGTTGQRVVIDGTGFTPDVEVFFGSERALDWDVRSGKRIMATAPSQQVAGQVQVIVNTPEAGSVCPTFFQHS